MSRTANIQRFLLKMSALLAAAIVAIALQLLVNPPEYAFAAAGSGIVDAPKG
jgi:hypothetical protein